jgi:hypothetical protein
MTKNLDITTEPGFIRVRVVSTATVSSSSVQAFFARVTDAARDAGVSKILYDARSATGLLSTMERFDYASRIAEQFRGLKVAFVVNQPLRDPSLFGETVAINRGAIIRVVKTLAEAYEWLEIEPPSKSAESHGK